VGAAFVHSVEIPLPTEAVSDPRMELSITHLRAHQNSHSSSCHAFKNRDIRYAFVPVERGYKHEYVTFLL